MREKRMRVAKKRLYSFIPIIVFFHSNHRILSLDSLYSFLTHPEGTVEPISISYRLACGRSRLCLLCVAKTVSLG